MMAKQAPPGVGEGGKGEYLCCKARTARKEGTQCALRAAREGTWVRCRRRHLEPLATRLGGVLAVVTLLLLHSVLWYPGCREIGAKKGPSAELIFK